MGCYPLTAGIESKADSLTKIINELKNDNSSERSGRLIDKDKEGSMDLKKRRVFLKNSNFTKILTAGSVDSGKSTLLGKFFMTLKITTQMN